MGLYHTVADKIRTRITSGEFPPGSVLPSEGNLTRQYYVSRDTMRDALAVLRSEGLIVSRRGAPTRVYKPPTHVAVVVSRDAVITARLSTDAERKRAHLTHTVPVLVVSTPGYPDIAYWADKVEIHQLP